MKQRNMLGCFLARKHATEVTRQKWTKQHYKMFCNIQCSYKFIKVLANNHLVTTTIRTTRKQIQIFIIDCGIFCSQIISRAIKLCDSVRSTLFQIYTASIAIYYSFQVVLVVVFLVNVLSCTITCSEIANLVIQL